MEYFFEILKAFFIGVVQGITEWLPISSTGHMILFDEFVKLNVSAEFMEMFRVVIQLGSILAVVVIYFGRLNPWNPKKSIAEKRETWQLWLKIVIAAIPAGIVGVLFDDLLDKYLYNYVVVAATLIIYGIVFIVIERLGKNRVYRVTVAEGLDNKTALKIGCFQMLSLIPGTSRSGSTIIGSMCVGVSRTAAAEFSFFLAIPVMFGASLLKIVKYIAGGAAAFTSIEIMTMAVGVLTAFVVSLVSLKFLVGFVRRHSFEVFGWYRIILGAAVIVYFIVG